MSKPRATQESLAVDRPVHQGLGVLDAKASAACQIARGDSDELVGLLIQDHGLDLLEQGVRFSDEESETGGGIDSRLALDFADVDCLRGRRAVRALDRRLDGDAHGSLLN